jgi:hypothetical protein
MRKRNVIDRRRLMIRAAEVAGAALMLGGCDRLVGNDTTKAILASAERLTARVQRLVSPPQSLAREYTETDLSPEFRANGTVDPDDDDYQEQSAKGFADWCACQRSDRTSRTKAGSALFDVLLRRLHERR